jgi:tetratricopeptide (TPR) repeat protein
MPDAPISPDHRFEQARADALTGRVAEALNTYRLILRDRPDDVNAHYYLGGMYLELGRLELALAHLKTAFDGNPAERVWLKYMTALLAAKRPFEARTMLDTGLQKWGFTGDNARSFYSTWCALQQSAAADPLKPVPLPDVDDADFYRILAKAWPFSMASTFGFVEAFYSLYQTVGYIAKRGIPGAFVECGSYLGGMSLLAALTFMKHGDTSRHLFLFDTFEGMLAPSSHDGAHLAHAYDQSTQAGQGWAKADMTAVRETMLSSGYPSDRIHLVKGKVEDTVPSHAPESISILRLDTDFMSRISTAWPTSTRVSFKADH